MGWLWVSLSSLSADTAGQLDVFGHDGDPLGVDGAQVGVLEQADQVRLAGLLQSHDSGALEAQVGLEVLSDFSHQALEGQLADQQLGGFLVATDLSQSHGTGPVTVRLLHSAGGRGALTSCLGGQLLPGGFASGGLTGVSLCSQFKQYNSRREQRLYKGTAGVRNMLIIENGWLLKEPFVDLSQISLMTAHFFLGAAFFALGFATFAGDFLTAGAFFTTFLGLFAAFLTTFFGLLATFFGLLVAFLGLLGAAFMAAAGFFAFLGDFFPAAGFLAAAARAFLMADRDTPLRSLDAATALTMRSLTLGPAAFGLETFFLAALAGAAAGGTSAIFCSSFLFLLTPTRVTASRITFSRKTFSTPGLLVDQTGDTLHSATASQTADSWLGDSLDVITENFTVTLGASFAESLSSFSSSTHFQSCWVGSLRTNDSMQFDRQGAVQTSDSAELQGKVLCDQVIIVKHHHHVHLKL
ncbi:hypothetical protein F7725_006544 [Dissostichus mawsoni]|uniref:Uncharacterized protein n=1 Tax=Dissostichus mawsoni TaxID=36200 RepID=A0A7J5XU94_DISMA|nr:hypothetical protein F7725_006544 [Dissostichus mawsoni]